MNQLTKLIEQYGKETRYRAMNWEGGFSIQFVEWLASRPTCGEEQRKFLDEVENFRIEDGLGIFCDNEIVYLSKNFNHLDINRGIKGE